MIQKRKHDAVFWLFLLPALIGFLLVIVIPFIMGIAYSFTDWSARPQPDGLQFVGFLNYGEALSNPSFQYSFILSIIYTILNMLVINAVAFGLALLVTSNTKLKNMYRVGFFLPNLIGGLILGYIWKFIFNYLFQSILGSNDPSTLILADRNLSVLAIVVAGTWQYAGYIMMIYVAAIIAVPEELFEAAKIDGANAIKRLRHIIIPMVAQAFTVTLFLTMVQSFKQYDTNVSLTGGGPATQIGEQSLLGTELLAMNIYNTAFISSNQAGSQARSVIFFIVLALIGIFQVRANKKREIEL
jgi:raffinose/stachyose/melibiose transport system permease protein